MKKKKRLSIDSLFYIRYINNIVIYYKKKVGFNMITVYNSKNKDKFKQIITNLNETNIEKTWIHLTKPTNEEIDTINKLTNINKNLLIKSLDEEETAHIEQEESTTLLVIDTLYEEDNHSEIVKYNTIPFSILINENFIVTTSMRDDLLLENQLNKYSNTLKTSKKITLILMILFYNAKTYIQSLKTIEQCTLMIESQLNQTMKNEGLLDMLELSKSLVYLSTSISSNLVVISKLEKMDNFKEYNNDIDLLEDIVIETNQAKETCSIYREILSGRMDAYAAIINNNVNSVMTLLTIVTAVVTIPTLIASIYGMNLKFLPFAESDYGFIIVIGLSIFLSIIGSILLIKFTTNKK